LYKVQWKTVNDEVIQEDYVKYGEGAEYDFKTNGYPQKDPAGSIYSLFKGWDKYPYSIKEEGVVLKPVFISAGPAGAANDGKLPDIAQLNAVCAYGTINNSIVVEETESGIEYSSFE
jgi:hypothetical protein